MSGLIITATNKTDLKLFADLANRMGVSVKALSDEDLLDLGLLKAMEEGKKSKLVSKESIMQKQHQIQKVDFNTFFGVSNIGSSKIDNYLNDIRNDWERTV